MRKYIKSLRSSQSPWEHGQESAKGHYQSAHTEGAVRVQNEWFSGTEPPQLKVLLSPVDLHSSLNQSTQKRDGRYEFPVTEAVLAGTRVSGAMLCRDRIRGSKYSCIHSINGDGTLTAQQAQC